MSPSTSRNVTNRSIPIVAALGAAFLIASGAPPPAAAQDERFAGSWVKDETRSDAPWRPPGTPPTKRTETKIDISLVGEDVTMVFTLRPPDWDTSVQVPANYITDNKPQEAPDFFGGQREVRVKWRKKKLNIAYTIKFGGFEADVQEVWEVSKNGQDLIQTIFGRTANSQRPDVRKFYHVRATEDQ